MRSRFLPLVALLVALALPAGADDLEELQRLHKELIVATWTGDAMWFEENLGDDFLLISPSGTIRTKRDVISELAAPGLKMEPFEPNEVRIRIHADTAVINGRMVQRYTAGSVRSSNDLRYTDVFVKKKGRWLLISGHASKVAQ